MIDVAYNQFFKELAQELEWRKSIKSPYFSFFFMPVR